MKLYAASEFLLGAIVTLFVIRCFQNGQTGALFLSFYFLL